MTRLVVCADACGRRKRPQQVVGHRWNGRVYYPKPKDESMCLDEMLDRLERCLGMKPRKDPQ